jgi:hypothetical protein
MGLNTSLALLPRRSPTMMTSMGAANELLVLVAMTNMLLELITGMANLLHLRWVYIMENELMGVAMAPGGLLLAIGSVLHMMLITYIMMSFEIMMKSLTVWENMNHILHHVGVLFLVTMVVPMPVVREKIVIALQR